MNSNSCSVKVAVVQAAPVLFDREKTIQKASDLVAEAAGQGAKIVLLPEAFVPAYPRGLSFGTVVGNRTPAGRLLWQRYWDNTIEVRVANTIAPHYTTIPALHLGPTASGLIGPVILEQDN